MRIARIVHVAGTAPCGSAGGDVERLYAIMADYRDDRRGVPVHLVVAERGMSLAARMPGLYVMDGPGEVIVWSTCGVRSVERRPESDLPPVPLPN